MKRGMVFFLWVVVSVALAGIASAGCANDNQTIMRLGAGDNAHGALWDQGYGVKVCYDDYFTQAYVPDSGENPHACGESLLWLNTASNAHASAESSGSYSINVCHRGLKNCEIKQPGVLCPSGTIAIVSLDNLTNSHISKGGQLNIYSRRICCEGQSAIIPPIVQTICGDYTYRADCNGDINVARGDGGCAAADKSMCRCIWNGTTETSGVCTVSWLIERAGCTYRCSVRATDQTQCSGGQKIVSLAASLVPVSGTNCLATTDPGCRSGSLTAPCGGAEAQLPFFGAWQIIGSLMAIALIYVLFGRKKSYIRYS